MSMRRQSSVSYNGIDAETPLNEHLSAKYMKLVVNLKLIFCIDFSIAYVTKNKLIFLIFRTFAFYTVKDRLPVILTKVVDHLARSKEELVQQYGPVR